MFLMSTASVKVGKLEDDACGEWERDGERLLLALDVAVILQSQLKSILKMQITFVNPERKRTMKLKGFRLFGNHISAV